MFWPFLSRRERLRREASAWIGRLNGPYEEEDRLEFERWYRSSPDRAEAYDRISARFAVAGRTSRPLPADAAPQEPVVPRRSRPARYALAAALACAALLAFMLLAARTPLPEAGAQQQFAAFASGEGETRRFVLADGSELLLSPGSRVEVALDATRRGLRLVRGEARFTVAHEERPFVVGAGGTEVLALGTRFVVRLASDRTTVSLIEGRVDVSYPAGAGSGRRRLARLRAGERLVVEAAPERSPAPSAVAAPAAPSPSAAEPAMLQFDDTPLGEAVEQANRHGRPPIRLGHRAIADLRVTGAFRARDTAGLAESVAAAFDLNIERGVDGTLWLRPRSESRSPR